MTSLLHWAVGYNNVAMARELLTLGASNLSNNLGTTPLGILLFLLDLSLAHPVLLLPLFIFRTCRSSVREW